MSNLVDLRVVLKFLGLDALTSADKNLELIRDSVESWIQTVYCRRTLVETTYKEKYDGTGCNSLVLDNYPITSLSRLSMGFDEAMRIKNTNYGAHASVSVSSTGVVLNKDGAVTTLLFATYTTINMLSAAICAVSGWVSTISLSEYGTFPSTVLVERMGLQCINNAEVGLMMPADGEWSFETDAAKGILYSDFGFLEGTRNISVEYKAGYNPIPKDLELATLILIKNVYQKRSEEVFGATNYSVGGLSVAFDKDIPMEAKQILNHYRRTLV